MFDYSMPMWGDGWGEAAAGAEALEFVDADGMVNGHGLANGKL